MRKQAFTVTTRLPPLESVHATPCTWASCFSTYNARMPYPEFFVAPMRQELTALGIQELRTAEDVDAAVANTPGTLMIVVNSVCGCAAGKARPGVALALRHPVHPDVVTTVFAGFDIEATERARSYFTGYPPSSPSIALLRNGTLVYMLERSQIENRDGHEVGTILTAAFDRFCGTTSAVRGGRPNRVDGGEILG